MFKKISTILICAILLAFPLVGCNSGEVMILPVDNELLYGRSILSDMPNAKALLYAYDSITEGISQSSPKISVYNGNDSISKDEFKIVYDAYRRDHAEHFWLGISYTYEFNDKTVLELKPEYVMSGSKLEKAKEKVENAVTDILSGIDASMSEYEKELYIYETLASKITYTETDNSHNLYGALVEGKAVCEGYAEAFQYILNRAGISSFLMIGNSKNPNSDGEYTGHGWNAVRIDGKYYHVDLTWDDQNKSLYHSYFNVSEALITQDHQINESGYPLPLCDSMDANYFIKNGKFITSYNVDKIVSLFDNEALTANFYLNSDTEAFKSWYKSNVSTIANKLKVNEAFSYEVSVLGNEIKLKIIKTNI